MGTKRRSLATSLFTFVCDSNVLQGGYSRNVFLYHSPLHRVPRLSRRLDDSYTRLKESADCWRRWSLALRLSAIIHCLYTRGVMNIYEPYARRLMKKEKRRRTRLSRREIESHGGSSRDFRPREKVTQREILFHTCDNLYIRSARTRCSRCRKRPAAK